MKAVEDVVQGRVISPDYEEFKEGSYVAVRESDGESYAQITYQPELFAFVLLYFEDDTFREPAIDEKGVKIDYLHEVGFDVLELIEE